MKKRKLKPRRVPADKRFFDESRELVRSVRCGWIGFFDGATEPNPGSMGIGAALFKDNLPIDSASGARGYGTNNIAEHLALFELLTLAVKHQAQDLLVCGDSVLVLLQIQKKWRIHKPHLLPLCEQTWALVAQLPGIRWAWIPREANTVADAL